jgi:hypothetical protein
VLEQCCHAPIHYLILWRENTNSLAGKYKFFGGKIQIIWRENTNYLAGGNYTHSISFKGFFVW